MRGNFGGNHVVSDLLIQKDGLQFSLVRRCSWSESIFATVEF